MPVEEEGGSGRYSVALPRPAWYPACTSKELGAKRPLAIELMGLQSLPIAVGVYLPISTSSAMFAGGVVRWPLI